MNKNNYIDSMNDLRISSDFNKRTQLLMKSAQSTTNKKETIPVKKYVFAIASFVLVLTAGLFTWNSFQNTKDFKSESKMVAKQDNDTKAYYADENDMLTATEEAESGLPQVTLPESDAFELTIPNDTYPVGTNLITLKIKNNSSEELWYGMDYQIEQEVNGEWLLTPGSNDLAFIDIAKLLAPNKEEDFVIDLSLLKPSLEAGNYRVVKTINNLVYYANFTLVTNP